METSLSKPWRPNDPGRIGFRPVDAGDYELLATWLDAPHMRQWWGPPETELGYIRDMVEGRDTTRPFLILLEGKPVGYIQSWFIGDHQNETWAKDAPWLMHLPADAVGVDLSLGEARLLSQGIGTAALKAFVDILVAEGRRTIVIDPDPTNLRAVRAYEKAGFRAIPDLPDRPADILLMQFEPKAIETQS